MRNKHTKMHDAIVIVNVVVVVNNNNLPPQRQHGQGGEMDCAPVARCHAKSAPQWLGLVSSPQTAATRPAHEGCPGTPGIAGVTSDHNAHQPGTCFDPIPFNVKDTAQQT